jgi:hypothetical protein
LSKHSTTHKSVVQAKVSMSKAVGLFILYITTLHRRLRKRNGEG